MISPRSEPVAKINALQARRDTFFVRTKKVTKEIRPLAATPSALLAVSGGRPTARPCTDDRRARSLARPFGLLTQTAAMLDAAKGNNAAARPKTAGIRRNTLCYCALRDCGLDPLPFCRAEHRRDFRTGPQGARREGAHSIAGTGIVPSMEPRKSREAQRSSRQWGGLFFGDFLLAGQKKVTRGRATITIGETTSNAATKPHIAFGGPRGSAPLTPRAMRRITPEAIAPCGFRCSQRFKYTDSRLGRAQ